MTHETNRAGVTFDYDPTATVPYLEIVGPYTNDEKWAILSRLEGADMIPATLTKLHAKGALTIHVDAAPRPSAQAVADYVESAAMRLGL